MNRLMNFFLRYKIILAFILGTACALILYHFSELRFFRTISLILKVIGWSLLFYVILKLIENKRSSGKVIDLEFVVKHRQRVSLSIAYLLTYFTVIPLFTKSMTMEGSAPCIWQFPVGSYCLDFYGEGNLIFPLSLINFVSFYLVSVITITILKRRIKKH
jgi:hypothetical protein